MNKTFHFNPKTMKKDPVGHAQLPDITGTLQYALTEHLLLKTMARGHHETFPKTCSTWLKATKRNKPQEEGGKGIANTLGWF